MGKIIAENNKKLQRFPDPAHKQFEEIEIEETELDQMQNLEKVARKALCRTNSEQMAQDSDFSEIERKINEHHNYMLSHSSQPECPQQTPSAQLQP